MMAAETVAWFMFGHERDDWMFDPTLSPWPRAIFWLYLAVWEWRAREKKVVDSPKDND